MWSLALIGLLVGSTYGKMTLAVGFKKDLLKHQTCCTEAICVWSWITAIYNNRYMTQWCHHCPTAQPFLSNFILFFAASLNFWMSSEHNEHGSFRGNRILHNEEGKGWKHLCTCLFCWRKLRLIKPSRPQIKVGWGRLASSFLAIWRREMKTGLRRYARQESRLSFERFLSSYVVIVSNFSLNQL